MNDSQINRLCLKARQDSTGRPVTLKGSVIRSKQLQMLSIFKRLITLTAHTPIQGTAHELLNAASECLDDITELLLELELTQ